MEEDLHIALWQRDPGVVVVDVAREDDLLAITRDLCIEIQAARLLIAALALEAVIEVAIVDASA